MSSSSTSKSRARKPKEAIKDPDPPKTVVEETHGSASKRKGKVEKSPPSSSNKKAKKAKTEVVDFDPEGWFDEEVIEDADSPPKVETLSKSKHKSTSRRKSESECRLDGEPIADAEARNRWPDRYIKKTTKTGSCSRNSKKKTDDDGEEILFALCHYRQAIVDGVTFCLGDDTYVQGAKGDKDYIGRIVEFFKTTDGRAFFTSQWFFKAEDTVIKDHATLVDKKRLFFSDTKNTNPLDCITSKIEIVKVSPNVDLVAKQATIPSCDFFYDMQYSLSYSTFSNLPSEMPGMSSGVSSVLSKDSGANGVIGEANMTLLDLYSGCGAMSTGLCLGASTAGVKLVTRWAVDYNEYACKSLKRNHDETEVRNESAESFLSLLKEWRNLCTKFSLFDTTPLQPKKSFTVDNEDAEVTDDPEDAEGIHDPKTNSGEFEVKKLVAICYGDPNETEEIGLYFKVRWKGYGPNEDTWEPCSGLDNCEERIKDFVTRGYNSNIIPLPGNVDVICGGPPCQGISGFNRFRDKENPLKDPKNYQLVVFMDIVDFLKPRFVLMENVVDIVKFSGGFLIRYAMGRLVSFDYQARLGMMVAGCYGLPQFRMRVFLWAARPTEKLPPYPLPTHEVQVRGVIPSEFEGNVVAYEVGHKLKLEKALVLRDAIFDLPPITNDEIQDEISYGKSAHTEFLRYIRSSKNELMGTSASSQVPSPEAMLYDHCPLKLNVDDYKRVSLIPKKKKANFRDLPGVKVRSDKKVELDTSVERIYLPSGAPLVPDYALSWKKGSATEPFGRVWWDEIVPTVVTRAQPHNRVILHPEQNRVLSVRENARLQGFPDYYKFCGPIKERYMQVGNAVAVPVARALGYVLGLADQGACKEQPLITLPSRFLKFTRSDQVNISTGR